MMEFSFLEGEKRQGPINSTPRQIPAELHTWQLLYLVEFNFPTCLLVEILLHTIHDTSNSTPLFEKQHLRLCCERSVNLFATKEPRFTVVLKYDHHKMLGMNIFPRVEKYSCINLGTSFAFHT